MPATQALAAGLAIAVVGAGLVDWEQWLGGGATSTAAEIAWPVTVKLGSGRRVDVFQQHPCDVIVDVLGYYQPEIQAKLTKSKANWRAEYVIEPAPQTTLERVEISVVGAGIEELAAAGQSLDEFARGRG